MVRFFRSLRFPLIILLPLFFLCPFGLAAADETPNPKVIILNSYHPGFTWSDDEMAGVLEELRRRYPRLDPAIEYLDDKRFPTAVHRLKMKDYLASKYQGHKFDLVIALDNAALDLALDFRPELFPGTPIVFAGVSGLTSARLAGKEKVTGVMEIPAIAETLELALALHPRTKEIFILHDYTITGKAMRRIIEQILPTFQGRVKFTFSPPAPMAEIVKQLKMLPDDTIVFIAAFATDAAGESFSQAETARHLTAGIKKPVYIVHEVLLGHGPVGGVLLDGREEGRRAGEIALRVLAGEDPSSIPVDIKSNARPMFDYRQLARFKIPESALPAGSIIINRPTSFYEDHKSLVWGASGVVVALGLLVIVLWINITRRRQAEQALQKNFHLLHSLFDAIPNPIFYKDKNGVYLGCNQHYEEFLGISHDALIGKTVFDISPQELADIYCKKDAELIEHPGVQVYDASVQNIHGQWRDVTFYKSTFNNVDGSLAGLVGVIVDITERKQAEAALSKNYSELHDTAQQLEQSRNMLQLIIESIPVRVFWKDSDLRYMGCNTLFARDAGLSQPEQLLGKDDFSMGWREQAEVYRADDRQVMESRRPKMNIVEPQTTPAGAKIWLNTSKVPLQLPNGEVFGVLGVYEDITARYHAEEALRESEEKFRLVFEKAPLGIMHYDQTSTITDCNEKFAEIIGTPKEEFIGFNMMRQLGDDKMRQAVAVSLKGEAGYYEGDYLSVTAGKLTPVRAIFQPIFSSDGVLSGGVTLFEDVSERQRAESERLQFNKLESLGTLAGGIAHDFNNILTAILGNIGLAALDDKIGLRVQDRLAQAEAACLRAQALSQQLLTFAKGGTPIKKLFSVTELLTESTAFSCAGSPVKCETSFPDNLWSIEADPGQIGQVFQNLIINAIQAMPTGGMIKVWAENLALGTSTDLPLSLGKYIKISVQDQGMGIPAEHLPRIFDPYFTTKQQGSGLGLASVYAIIKKHHGHIAVESKSGVGTTFFIYLPAVEQQATSQPAEDRELLVGKGKILVMDDEEIVRHVLGRMLARLGYEAEFARDGRQAIEMFVQAHGSGQVFAAVILDLTVPGGMGGKETIERLLEIDPRVKAVVSSGYSDDPIMADFTKYGFSGVIAKPYKISELGKILQGVVMGQR
jgi:PAS domain S-box-containing protein